MRHLAALLPLALLGGCLTDGQTGDNGLVRFSQIVNFVETDDFESPIVVGGSIFIALQDPASDPFFDPETFTELTLRVEDGDNPGEDTDKGLTFPLGFAQYGAVFFEPGTYRLVAEDKGVLLDALTVTVDEAESVRLSSTAFLTTNSVSEPGCFFVEEIDPRDTVVPLHPNQNLDVFVVPQTADGEPMLGLLSLSAEADSQEISLDAPLIGQNSPANALFIRPSFGSFFGGPLEVTITEEVLGQQIVLPIESLSDPLDVSCQ